MLEIAGIDHVVLKTNKLNDMLNFYCNLLGCKLEKQQPAIKLTQLRAGICIIDLIEVDRQVSDEQTNMDHFCLQIKNFHYEALKNFLTKNGIAVSSYGKRYGAEGYGMSFFVKDPQGNSIELKESKP